jgi:predicted transcriptional regulator
LRALTLDEVGFLGQHRTSLQILAEILKIVRSGARKTRIMYQANLSFTMLKKYLDYAQKTELVVCPENSSCYFATPKGHEFLEKYDRYLLRNRQVEDQLQAMAKERAMLEEGYTGRQRRKGPSAIQATSRQ